ncbi:hypothetical protein [Sphingobium sp. BS19]|uniref:hypothetical protein n=1 Tax=Sphingobium sp. BS19 TaxID=3018973 RepID=UPI0024911347|nr:hypothetical protein [Sphingobium sp. BS19]
MANRTVKSCALDPRRVYGPVGQGRDEWQRVNQIGPGGPCLHRSDDFDLFALNRGTRRKSRACQAFARDQPVQRGAINVQ